MPPPYQLGNADSFDKECEYDLGQLHTHFAASVSTLVRELRTPNTQLPTRVGLAAFKCIEDHVKAI